VFDPAVLDLDLRGVLHRLRHTHTGWRKLGSAYRADKREVAAVARSSRATPEVLERLDEALAWQASAARLDAAEARHATVLGRFAEPRHNRLNEARAALQRITTAQQRLGDDYNPAGLAAQLGGAQPEDPQLGTRAASLQNVLTELAATAKELLGDAKAVAQLSPAELTTWAVTLRDHVAVVAAIVAGVDGTRHAPATLSQARADIEQRIQLDAVEADIAATAEADQSDFEAAYQGVSTDTASLDQALSWVEELQQRHGGPLPPAAVQALHPDGPPLDPGRLHAALTRADQHRGALVEAFDDDRADEIDRNLTGSLHQAHDFARALADHTEEIEEWRAYRQARATLEAAGWAKQLTEAAARQIEPTDLGDALRRALWVGWLDAVTPAEPELLTARADDLDAWVAEFRQLDKAMLDTAAEHVVERCAARRPRSSHGASSIIEREANKKKKHMPIRQLLARTEDVAKALKPCFAMSPLTVSQFLPPEFTFDVVIFDEASQVTPADAVNCVYRGRQLVVTGDDKQLPPTNFFDVASMDDSDEYQENQFDEFESIITQCKSAAGMPSLPLRWHYRSHHEDLITFSNYQYYAPDNQRLHTFPGARTAGEDLGVHLFEVDGVYRRGGPRDNPIEADRVAERVRLHAERILAQPSGERETIGVVAFSVAQADAIEHRLDQLRQDHPDLEEFFAADRLAGFFVKNLENVQGDERDIMIFSVGYGPDEHGQLKSNFGPLNGPQGHRRLNVVVTRARKRVEVLCSFAPSQLDSSKATHRGVPDLKRYLEYARQGLPALGVDLSGSQGDVESPFEESVLDVIRSWGFDVDPQVGTAGYRIDLGVRHPDEPDRYAIGIECDGRAYHSTRVARDRDRLRAQVLRGLGWNLHRIWGPSWYRDRSREAQRLRQAIDEAIGAGPPRHERAVQEQVDRETDEVEPLDPVLEQPDWADAYEPLWPRDPSHAHPADAGAFRETRQIVRDVLQHEAPIHFEVLARRVADVFGRSLTDRVRRATSDAVLTLGRQGQSECDGDWVRLLDTAVNDVAVRVPTDDPHSVRDIEHIPPEELDEAVDRLVGDAHLIAEDDLLTAVSRLFGVARTSKRIHATLQEALERLIAEQRLERNDQGMIRVHQSRRA
jgi:very-short-patch-repair endonuclease